MTPNRPFPRRSPAPLRRRPSVRPSVAAMPGGFAVSAYYYYFWDYIGLAVMVMGRSSPPALGLQCQGGLMFTPIITTFGLLGLYWACSYGNGSLVSACSWLAVSGGIDVYTYYYYVWIV